MIEWKGNIFVEKYVTRIWIRFNNLSKLNNLFAFNIDESVDFFMELFLRFGKSKFNLHRNIKFSWFRKIEGVS